MVIVCGQLIFSRNLAYFTKGYRSSNVSCDGRLYAVAASYL